MKISPILILSSLCFGLFFTACKKERISTQDALQTIPADALNVYAINAERLMQKADFEAVKEMDFFKTVLRELREEEPLMARLLENPENSGVDLALPIYISQHLEKDNISWMHTLTCASVKDAEQLNGHIAELKLEANKKEGYQYATLTNQSALAWNDQFVIVATSTGYPDFEALIKNYLNPEEGAARITDQNGMASFQEGQHDIRSYTSTTPYSENPGIAFYLGFAGIDAQSLKDGYLVGYQDFLDGRIESEGTWSFKNEFSKHFRPFFKDQLSSDILKKVPAANLQMFGSGALDPSGIQLFLDERAGAKTMINTQLQQLNLSITDLLKSMGGDIVYAMYDGRNLVTLNLDDQEAWKKVLDATMQAQLIQTAGVEGLFTFSPTMTGQVSTSHFLEKEGFLYFSDDKNLLMSIQSGEEKMGLSGKAAKAAGNHIGAFQWEPKSLDLLLQAVPQAGIRRMLQNASEEMGLQTVDMLVDRQGMVFEATMKDESQNSLKTLFQAVEAANQSRENNEEETPVLPEEDRVEETEAI